LFISDALAQAVLYPPAPPPGVSPVLEWLWTILGGLALTAISAATLWFKNWAASQQEHAEVANQQARSQMIAATVENAAHMALARLQASGEDISTVTWPLSPILQEAVAYVCVSRPEAIAATDQADEEHLAKFILATMHRILNQQATLSPPAAAVLPASFTAGRILPVEATVVPASTAR
jgi:hypothetical protein